MFLENNLPDTKAHVEGVCVLLSLCVCVLASPEVAEGKDHGQKGRGSGAGR